jgi:ketosteroid isomerase-like protein
VKRVTTFSILLILGAVSWMVSRAQVRASDEETVRKLDDQERLAALKRDAPALERLWSDQFTVNAPNNAVVVGKSAVMDTFVHSGVINFSSFERKIEFVHVDGDFAFIMGLETLKPLSDAPSAGLVAGQEVRRRFTNIWKKEAGTWRLYARHANVIPQR